MFNIGPQELLLILVLALLVVGPQRLPEIARTVGRGMREFRKAQDEVRKTIQINLDEPSTPTPRRPRRLPVDDPDTPTPSEPMDPGAAPSTSSEPTDPRPAAAISSEGSSPTNGSAGVSGSVLAAAAAARETAPPPSIEEPGVNEISRTLGRTLAELRRAREEVQRSFRIDADPPASRPAAPRAAATSVPERPATPPGTSADGSPGAREDAAGPEPSRDDLERPA